MATIIVDASNYNDATFWASVNLSATPTAPGDVLDLSTLPATWVTAWSADGSLRIWDGTGWYVIGRAGASGTNASLGGTTSFVMFEEVIGGPGNDTLTGSATNDRDSIFGGNGDDLIRGGAGDDTIDGGTGTDWIEGGSGDDTIALSDGFGPDTVDGGDSNQVAGDTLDASAVTTDLLLDLSAVDPTATEDGTITDATGNVTFTEIEIIRLGLGNDSVIGSTTADSVFGGAGADTFAGDAGNDRFDMGADADADLIVLADGAGDDLILNFTAPTANPDGTFTGHDLLDVSGLTTLAGAPIRVTDVTVTDDGAGNAVLHFPSGDSLTLIGVPPAALSDPQALVALGIPSSDGTILGSTGDDVIDAGYLGDPDGDLVDGADALPPAAANDDIIAAGDGNDTVLAGNGQDQIDGGTGDDSLDGDAGNDSAQGGLGQDLLFGGAGDDTLSGGADDDQIFGGAGNDSLSGGDGADTFGFDPGDGADTVAGGEGGLDADILSLSALTTGVTVIITGDESGTITAGADQITFTQIERLDLTLQDDTLDATGTTAALSVEGYAGADSLTGGTGHDNLSGGADNDSLQGGGGDDTFHGGDGDDSLTSGTGNDYHDGGTGNDTITTGDGDDTAYAGTGADTVDGGTGADWLYGGADADSVTGGDGADWVAGDDGNDTLSGGTGDDTVDAGDGDDTITLTDDFGWDSIDGGATGQTTGDTLDASAVTADLTLDLSASDATSAEDGTLGDATAQVFFTEIEGFTLGAGHDSIIGSAGDDSVSAGAGADTFAGGAGNDRFDLGADADADLIVLADGAGDDLILNFTAPTANPDGSFTGHDLLDVSGLTTAAGTPIRVADVTVTDDGAGNAVLLFPSGDSLTLIGISPAALSDPLALIAMGIPNSDGTILGTAGDDVIDAGYLGDPDGDRVDAGDATPPAAPDDDVILAGDGQDTVMSGAGNDRIEGGTGNDSLDGDSGDDTLLGGDDNDTLHGKAGRDVLEGGMGNDTLYGEDDADLLLGDDGNDRLEAGNGSDSLQGGGGDDTLYGGAGADEIIGGTGSDDIHAEAGNDTIIFAQGDVAYGGDGDDLFQLEYLLEQGDGPITIIGGNGDQTSGDTLQLGTIVNMGTLDITSTGPNGMSGTVQLFDGTLITFSEIENIICFTPGTRIATPHGARPIEDLALGDLVVTRDHGLRPIRWIGRRTVPAIGRLAPVRIRPGVVTGLERPLLVSPQHRMLFQGYRAELLFGDSEVLVAAAHLVDGLAVTQDEGGMVTYIHILFDEHEIIYAEGAATESFHPGGIGLTAIEAAAREELFTVFPELRAMPASFGPSARRSLRRHEAQLIRR